jgi:hypothetical protein
VITWQTVYNDLNRCKNGQSILCDTHLGPPSFWTSSMKGKIEETGKQPKGGGGEPTQVQLKILQESNNHESANTKISCNQLNT